MAVSAPGGAADPVLEASAADQRRIPSGTTALFSLLVATVLATNSVVFVNFWFLVPGHSTRMSAALQDCFGRELATGSRIETLADLYRTDDMLHRFAECMAPVYRDQVSWAGYGTLVLFGLAAVIYWGYPRRISRRGGLVPLDGEHSTELMTYLAGLSREAGLSRPPTFLLAPYQATGSGLAFGHIARRYVQLNAGLVVWFTTDRPKFRAVVLHELAHLRNRDVDTTYLTKSIWWAFVVVAMAPWVVIFAAPLVLSPGDNLGGLLPTLALVVLTAVVVLTRNAILRVRETYADARAARCEGPDGVLPEVVAKLTPPTGPRWLTRIGTHPHRDDRLKAIRSPDILLRPRIWELFVVGMAGGMILRNLQFVLLQSLPAYTGLIVLVAGLVCVPGLIGPLVAAVWRGAVVAPQHRLPRRAVLLLPTVLMAGFLLGEHLAFLSVLVRWSSGARLATGGALGATVAVVPLLVAGILLAAWTAAVAHSVLNSSGRGRRAALPLVVVSGVGAFAGWFTVLIGLPDATMLQFLLPLNEVVWYDLRLPGIPDWGTALAHLVTTKLMLVHLVSTSPLTLPGMALLWLVPIILAARYRLGRGDGTAGGTPPPYRVSTALTAGLIGAGAYVLTAVTILVLARAGLPADVRRSDGFLVATHYSLVALAVVVQAVVAGVLAACVRRYRAVLVPLAVMLTGMLSSLALLFGLGTLTRVIDFYDRDPRRDFVLDPEFLNATVHEIMVQGAVLAVPAALLGLLAGTVGRRRLRPGSTARERDNYLLRPLPAVTMGVLVVTVLLASAAGVPRAYQSWVVDSRSGTAAAAQQPCVVGLWQETSRRSDVPFEGIGTVRFSGEGGLQQFFPDGTVVVQFAPESAMINGQVLRMSFTGVLSADYRIEGDWIYYSNATSSTTWTLTLDGKTVDQGRMNPEPKPDHFTCSDDTMVQDTDSYRAQLTRVHN